jgi:hypothetical protein
MTDLVYAFLYGTLHWSAASSSTVSIVPRTFLIHATGSWSATIFITQRRYEPMYAVTP